MMLQQCFCKVQALSEAWFMHTGTAAPGGRPDLKRNQASEVPALIVNLITAPCGRRITCRDSHDKARTHWGQVVTLETLSTQAPMHLVEGEQRVALHVVQLALAGVRQPRGRPLHMLGRVQAQQPVQPGLHRVARGIPAHALAMCAEPGVEGRE